MLLRFLVLFALGGSVAPATEPPAWSRVSVTPMKTSIYVGSVRLTASEFVRDGETFAATYEAKVTPWFFWSERGQIALRVGAGELARLAAGERIAFAGEATNHKGKPRRVTGHAQSSEPGGASGRIKVRIHIDDVTLAFDGEYRAAVSHVASPP